MSLALRGRISVATFGWTLLCGLILSSVASASTLLDPRLVFRTIATEHFRIYFHQGEELAAQRLAAIAEETWPKVGRALGIAAPRRTHVILADQSELANGWATPLPYNTIFVTAAAPSGSEFIGRDDDWLRLVFTHEFTHIVHLDRSEGWAKLFRGLFGRTPVAFPNLWLPQWMVEGLATFQESAITGKGRLHAGDFRAIEREAARAQRVEPIDRVNGGLTDWPGGSGGYAFGLGFHDFLAGRFGADTFGDLAEKSARALPLTGALAFDDVYGASVDALWRDYAASLEAAARSPVPLVGPTPTRLTHHGHTVLGPRLRPPSCASCPQQVVYSVRNPDGFPSLQEVEITGGPSRVLTSRYLGSTSGVTQDAIVFDQQEFRRNVGLYSDLYRLDTKSGKVSALSSGARYQDPDVSPDGRQLVAVRQNADRRDLVVVPFSGRALGEPRVLASAPSTSFNAPRWSPDGLSIAVARGGPNGVSEIVVFELATGTERVIASAADARIVTPAWMPDGRSLLAAADFGEATFNLYEFSVGDTGTPARQVSFTSGGATWPDVSRDGRTIVFVGYTADGFDLFTLPYPFSLSASDTERAPAVEARRTREDVQPGTRSTAGYSPWNTLAPVTWVPLLIFDDQTRVGAAVGGADVLAHHAWNVSATWLVDAPAGSHRPPAATPDWSASYAYDRWRPSIFASASRDTTFFSGRSDALSAPVETTIEKREVELGVYLPFRHARITHRLLASAVASVERTTPNGVVENRDRVSLRLGASTSSAHVFGYSISPERGVTAGGTVEVTRRAFGANDDASVVTGDVRGYLPGAGTHDVVALRAAGGVGFAALGAGRNFLMGGAGPSVDVIDFSRDAIGLLRGFATHSVTGTHVVALNADYRVPIARPQRGVGVWPIFLHTIYASAFVDAGSAWTSRWNTDAVKTSVGGELSFAIVAGYSFPVTISIGSGWGHDVGDGSNRGTLYLRLGRAF